MAAMLELRSLWELLEARATATPDALFGVDERGRTLRFAELMARAELAAAGLAATGIESGDVVSWQLPTWFDSAILVVALSRLGAIQNPILPIYRQREVGFVCAQAKTKLLVVPGQWRGFDYLEMASQIAAHQPGLEILVVNADAGSPLPEADTATLEPVRDAGNEPVRWYFYTSGTTADPKGAQHTDLTVGASAIAMSECQDLRPDDRAALVFPFTHIGGIGWLYNALLVGCQLVFVEAFDAKSTPAFLGAHDITVAGAGTPFHMAYLAAQRAQPDVPLFPNLRLCTGGGAPKPPQLHHDCKSELGGVGIVSGYGLTEAPIIAMAWTTDADDVLAETEGRATRDVQLRAVALDGTVCAVGEEGEIRAKGPQLMKGYLDPSLDAAAFDDEGWFRSGDLGTLDAAGNVRITGRVKDIIIRNMENISAKELEDLLFTHPKVADVAVVGLPDERTGERACAVVVAAAHDDAPTLPELNDFLLEHGLMKQKLPEQLEVLASLPRNPTGKVVKFELRAELSKH
ncbi:MAG: AMP-binding protein [Acidimicrobiales bacterium]